MNPSDMDVLRRVRRRLVDGPVTAHRYWNAAEEQLVASFLIEALPLLDELAETVPELIAENYEHRCNVIDGMDVYYADPTD